MTIISEIIILGDSLSDTGNFGPANPALTGLLGRLPGKAKASKPFYRPQSAAFRFTDCWNWVDFLEQKPHGGAEAELNNMTLYNPNGQDFDLAVPMHVGGIKNFEVGGAIIDGDFSAAVNCPCMTSFDEYFLPRLVDQIQNLIRINSRTSESPFLNGPYC